MNLEQLGNLENISRILEIGKICLVFFKNLEKYGTYFPKLEAKYDAWRGILDQISLDFKEPKIEIVQGRSKSLMRTC